LDEVITAFGRAFSKFFEIGERSGSLSLLQRAADYRIPIAAHGPMPRDIERSHIGKGTDPGSVFVQEEAGGLLAAALVVAGHAPGQHNARGAALHVPLPRAAHGLVKIVDVQHDLGAGRGKEAEVLEMSVPANLDFDAGTLSCSQISSHDLHRPAKEAKG